ncbi:LysR family transcriptional regulator [Micromonospora sp. DT229]|uniref:LysR family transcriptional regulator n=1 Tax=Micromonospora sp. DT229 TaxID=3393430 RepID=UPI003CE86D6D
MIVLPQQLRPATERPPPGVELGLGSIRGPRARQGPPGGLRRLRFLREFEERGTLAAGAAALGYSPSTVSQQLTLLEQEVGARLLTRAGRGYGSPTPDDCWCSTRGCCCRRPSRCRVNAGT